MTESRRTALITGITGQDGQYMAEHLLAKDYRVVGSSRNTERARGLLDFSLRDQVELIDINLADAENIRQSIRDVKPDEIYNFAAYSSGAGMFDEPVAQAEINGLAVMKLLEAIRATDSGIRFCQASSSELFGQTCESPQSEATAFNPRSPYGAAKLYAHHIIGIYRKHHGLHASSAILFNHESPRRGLGFVTRKITSGAARIKLGQVDHLTLGNLEARRDWGFAGDYVRAMWLMSRNDAADDYVLATGETHSVRDLCEVAFSRLGLDYTDFVSEDLSVSRPLERVSLVGDSTKARTRLGWHPEVSFQAMIERMVDADLIYLSDR